MVLVFWWQYFDGGRGIVGFLIANLHVDVIFYFAQVLLCLVFW